MDKDQITEHLKFAAELGVAGVSSDPKWRARSATVTCATADRPRAHGQHSTESRSSRARLTHLISIRTDIGDCTRCKLHTLGRKQIVFGVGNPDADLMFVGEAPGADEDVQGIPFVGRAGQLLTKIIEAIDLTRDDVYIANVIKCRPPGNRNPEPDEVDTCEPFLFQQIDAIKPKVIVAPWHVRGAHAAEDARSDFASARAGVRIPRREADSDVSSGLPAAQPVLEARGMGRYETCPEAPPV